MFRRRFVVALGAMAALSACRRESGPADQVLEYALRGTVVRLRESDGSRVALIRHEPILDAQGKVWMEAMTMEFPIMDEREFAKLKPDLAIRATVYQRESDFVYWLGGIRTEP